MFEPRKLAARQRTLLSLLTAAAALAVTAARADTLSEIYLQVRANDPVFGAARAQAAAGREKEAQGRAGLLPNVSAGASLQRVEEHSSYVEGNKRSYSNKPWNLTLNQPLLRLANVKTYQQGVLQAALADQQLRLAEQELLLRTAKAYFDVLQAQDAMTAMTAQLEAFAQQLAQSKRSFDVGLSSITELNEAQTRHDLGFAQEIAARNDLEVRRRTLEKLLGRELPPLAPVDPAAPINVLSPAEIKQLLERAPFDALQVGAGELAEQVAELEVGRQRAAHAPTVDLVLRADERNASVYISPGNSRNYTAGLELNVPIFQGGAISSYTREAEANLERARQQLLDARAQATLEARQAYLGVQSGSALSASLRQAQASGETQVKSTTRGFEVGTRTRVDVLNTVQQLYATRKDLSAARYQTLMSSLQLKAAAGALSEGDLRALDQLLLRNAPQ
ncbi:TolC family outer membrane protein [Roseateles violae]|uniref:TolC family outer membrane protein n=1 Tax=Roseateles violae TaxID=3058042 RepID=A0ABT8DWQ9_9BURK|nr:TolC family outer membrane protein [Pelomonas sp. PFR6]MDN3921525.1 TolC family outer membrane protein [Pelomonas sp. PFR6]